MKPYLDHVYIHAARRIDAPATLAGFQHIESGTVKEWDLIVTDLGIAVHKSWALSEVGAEAEQLLPSRVYRKIPVCAHLNTPETRAAAGFGEAQNLPESWVANAAGSLHAPAEKARTLDDGKPALAHVPTAALVAIAAAQAYGARKYGDFNNFRKGMEVTRNLSCALRHIYEFLDGSDADHESGLNPLDHAIARLAFVLQNLKDGTAIDDRHSTLARTPAPKGAA